MRFLSVNASDHLARPALLASLLSTKASLIYVAEAFREDDDYAETVRAQCELNGYLAYFAPYDDTDDRADRHVHAMLVAKEYSQLVPRPMWLGTRSCLVAETSQIVCVGVHFDDHSKGVRKEQAHLLLDRLGGRSALILGSVNEARPYTCLGRTLSSTTAQRVIDRLPRGVPGHDQSSLEWLGSHAERLVGMTSGEVVWLLKSEGFTELDPKHRATKLIGRRLPLPIVQLDYMMLRYPGQDRSYVGFRRLHLPVIDHLAVVADLPSIEF